MSAYVLGGPRNEYLVHDCLMVDIALVDARIILEVDGPAHFVQVLRKRQGDTAGFMGTHKCKIVFAWIFLVSYLY